MSAYFEAPSKSDVITSLTLTIIEYQKTVADLRRTNDYYAEQVRALKERLDDYASLTSNAPNGSEADDK